MLIPTAFHRKTHKKSLDLLKECSKGVVIYTLGLDIEFNLDLEGNLFQVKSLAQPCHEVNVYKNKRNFCSGGKLEEMNMIMYLEFADIPLTGRKVGLHRQFSGICFNKDVLRRELKRAREEGRNSETINI
eukprot:snap_masked-scaffold_6-processed-gene-14.28-mRNA-1 protein AED:1.00 eAED:1.00 QI:0/0/0/0/1/1/2/0/129